MVWACHGVFPSSLVPSLHVLVFGKKTFLCLVLVVFFFMCVCWSVCACVAWVCADVCVCVHVLFGNTGCCVHSAGVGQ